MKNTADKTLLVIRLLAVFVTSVVSFRIAWLSDDSMITLRTALNITHGWGSGFNATESVQAFTHPLWFLLWVSVGVLTNQWVWGILLVGIALTSIAVGILVWRTQSIARIILLTGMLIFSNGFIEYSTSGLENPLAYFTIALAFSLTVLKTSSPDKWWLRPALIGAVFAAVFLTRFDLMLSLVPAGLALVFAWRKVPKKIVVASTCLAAPIVVWFSWSWATYHSLLPNTFAAKTNTEIPRQELFVQGLRYLYISFENDPVSLLMLLIGVLAGLVYGTALVRAWTLGLILYVIYIVAIGGDFMASRFLAIPVFLSALILAVISIRREASPPFPSSEGPIRDPLFASGAAIVVLIFTLLLTSLAGKTPVAVANYQSERWQFEQNTNGSISDERGFYVANGKSLKEMIDKLSLAYINPDIAPLGDGSGLNRTLREINKAAQNWPYADGGFTLPSEVGAFCGGLGYLGMATGPITHLVDTCALTDRFLAQQPFAPTEPFAWRPGHLARPVPEGYLDAIATGDPRRLVDGVQAFELEQLWKKLR
jgi:arabinofuranosyltransferase